MSIDARARAATDELGDVVVGHVPAATELVRLGTRRRRTRTGVLVAVTALVVAGGVALGTRGPSVPEPAAPRPAPTFGMSCQLPGITCRDGRIYVRGLLRAPVSLVPAAEVNTDDFSPGMSNFEIRRTDHGPLSGLTVFEDLSLVDGDRDHPVALNGGARQAAEWLAARAFVVSTEPQKVRVGGFDAWRVEVTMRAGASLPSFANAHPAALTFLNGDGFANGGVAAVSEQLKTSYYYLVDLPSQPFALVWVWTSGGKRTDLDAMDAMVPSLRFG